MMPLSVPLSSSNSAAICATIALRSTPPACRLALATAAGMDLTWSVAPLIRAVIWTMAALTWVWAAALVASSASAGREARVASGERVVS